MLFERTASRKISDCHVLIVDDQTSSRLIMTTLLEEFVHCHTATSAKSALAFCSKTLPDLVLLDVCMPDMDGHEVCRHLANMPKTQHIPVVFVTASVTDEEQERCWNAGGVDFIQKPINATTLVNRVKSHLTHKLKTDLLERLIYIDRLTGCLNRHYLEDRMPLILREAIRDEAPLSVIIFDVDHFKLYNDSYGHIEGDACLMNLASTIKQSLLRPMDRLIRTGGEEFLVLLPNTDEQGTKTVGSRLVSAVNSLRLPHKASPLGHVTISAGAATFLPLGNRSIDDIMQLADNCVYEAKHAGRNTFFYINEAAKLQHVSE